MPQSYILQRWRQCCSTHAVWCIHLSVGIVLDGTVPCCCSADSKWWRAHRYERADRAAQVCLVLLCNSEHTFYLTTLIPLTLRGTKEGSSSISETSWALLSHTHTVISYLWIVYNKHKDHSRLWSQEEKGGKRKHSPFTTSPNCQFPVPLLEYFN